MYLMINLRNRCQRLLHLNLGYNKISHVESGDFEWAEDLEILLLRNNILTKLKAETFKGAGALPVNRLRKYITRNKIDIYTYVYHSHQFRLTYILAIYMLAC